MIEHDVIADDAADVAAVALEAGQLLGDVHPVVGGYLDVASRHHDVRCDSNLHIHSEDLHGFVGCPVSVETDLLSTDPAFGAVTVMPTPPGPESGQRPRPSRPGSAGPGDAARRAHEEGLGQFAGSSAVGLPSADLLTVHRLRRRTPPADSVKG